MEKYDLQRAKNAKLAELDKETLEKSNHLLTKAQMQIEEQEDDIKHLNELMLYAKCVCIRDNQLEQKVSYPRGHFFSSMLTSENDPENGKVFERRLPCRETGLQVSQCLPKRTSVVNGV